MMAERLTALAPAKINLALHVTGQRADGYHLLDSLVVFARFGDEITVEPAAEDTLAVQGPYGESLDTLDPSDNLVIKARDGLRRAFEENGWPSGPVSIELTKRLPPASGLGGGSADAAATLKLLQTCWQQSLETEELGTLALKLGADVPMCLKSGSLRAEGIGEILTPLTAMPALSLVLVNPMTAVSTPAVFGRLSKRDNAAMPPVPAVTDGASLAQWLRDKTRNDLQAPANSLVPEISACLSVLEARGALLARMSGSGATCFGLFATAGEAESAAKAIATQHPDWFVQPTQCYGSGENGAEETA